MREIPKYEAGRRVAMSHLHTSEDIDYMLNMATSPHIAQLYGDEWQAGYTYVLIDYNVLKDSNK